MAGKLNLSHIFVMQVINNYLDEVEQNIVHDLSVPSRSIIIICRSRRLRQIIDLRDNEKSRYFAVTEHNNCFIIRSPSLFSYFNHFLAVRGRDLPFSIKERGSFHA